MAGIHVVQRTTDSLHSFVIEATTILHLPSSVTYRSNTDYGVHGAFPEFIHGFYVNGYGFDAGIMYQDGHFWLFYGPYNTGSWKQYKIGSAARLGKTVTFNTKLYTNGVMLTCSRSGDGSTTMSAAINSTAYKKLKKGCKFVREMCLAINPERNGHILVPTGASFSSTTFSKTNLKMANGTTNTLTSLNSIVLRDQFDTDTKDHSTYVGNSTSSNTGTYISDTGYGSI